MAMTAPQRATVRRRTSAADTTAEMTDAVLDAIYDDPTQGNSNLDYTTYYVLRDMVGVAINSIDTSNQVDALSLKSSQRYDHLKNLLDYWGMVTGLGVLVDLAIAAGGIAAPCNDIIECEDCP